VTVTDDGQADGQLDGQADIARIVSGFEAALASLREDRDREIGRLRDEHERHDIALRDEHGRLVAVIEAKARDAQQRADRAEAALSGERARGDVLRDRLEAAERGQREAQLAQLREDDAARQARGLLARLLAAWHGD
jgi:hypothetical protein